MPAVKACADADKVYLFTRAAKDDKVGTDFYGDLDETVKRLDYEPSRGPHHTEGLERRPTPGWSAGEPSGGVVVNGVPRPVIIEWR